jgi:hypothetical protein
LQRGIIHGAGLLHFNMLEMRRLNNAEVVAVFRVAVLART